MMNYSGKLDFPMSPIFKIKVSLWLALLLNLFVIVPTAQATITELKMYTLFDGRTPFDADDTAGNDSSRLNGVVRTHDRSGYRFVVVTNGGDENVLVTLTLPVIDTGTGPQGDPAATFLQIPPQCGPASTLSADGATLVCDLGDIPNSSTVAIEPRIMISGSAPNGQTINFSAPASNLGTASVASNETPALDATYYTTVPDGNDGLTDGTEIPSLVQTVSAAPRWDLNKSNAGEGGIASPTTHQLVRAITGSGPNGEDGLILMYSIYLHANRLVGSERLDPDAVLQFTDVLSTPGFPAVESNLLLNTWNDKPLQGSSPGGFMAGMGCANGAVVPTFWITDIGSPSMDARTVANGGTCTAAQTGAGTPISVQITGTDTSLEHFPTELPTGNLLDIPEYHTIVKTVSMWVPLSVLPDDENTLIPFSNRIDWDSNPVSISGQTNVDPNEDQTNQMDNQTRAINFKVETSGQMNKFFTRANGFAVSELYPTIDFRSVTRINILAPGQRYSARYDHSNRGTKPIDSVICDRIDNSRNVVFDAFAAGGAFSEPNGIMRLTINGAPDDITFEWGVQVGDGAGNVMDSWGTYINLAPEADGGNELAGNQIRTALGAGVIDDAASLFTTPGCPDADPSGNTAAAPSFWFETLDDLRAAGFTLDQITMFRTVASLKPAESFSLEVGMQARESFAFDAMDHLVLPDADLADVSYSAGDTIPFGTHVPNWAFMRVESDTAILEATQTDEVEIDNVYYVRVDKSASREGNDVPNNGEVGVTQTVLYKLEPRLTTPNLPGSPQQVVVTDILPPGMTYLTTTAGPGLPDVSPDTPAAGFTTLVWTYPAVTAQVGGPGDGSSIAPAIEFTARVDADLMTGDAITNWTAISSDANEIEEDCVYDMTNNPDIGYGDCDKAGFHTLTISAPPGFQVFKEALSGVVEANENIRYQANWAIFGSAVDDMRVIDIFPYVGDGRTPATAFSGTLSLNAVTAVEQLPAQTFEVYYTNAASSTINADPMDLTNALPPAVSIWCAAANLGTMGCPASLADATAVYVHQISTLQSGNIYGIELEFTTSGNIEGDIYTNNHSANDTGEILDVLVSNDVNIPVVASEVGDFVWHDLNGDGMQDAGEPGIANVNVTIRGDFDGNGEVDTPITIPTSDGTTDYDMDGVDDAVGFYFFPGLHSGEYTVTVDPATLPNGAAAWLPSFDEDDGATATPMTPHTTVVTVGFDELHDITDFGYLCTLELQVTKTVDGLGADQVAIGWGFDFTLTPVGTPAVLPSLTSADMNATASGTGFQTSTDTVTWSQLVGGEQYTLTEVSNDGYSSGVLTCDVTDEDGIADASITFTAPGSDLNTSVFELICEITNTALSDFGDAPDTATNAADGTGAGNYQTLLIDDGPRHYRNSGTVFLGATVDYEDDATQNATASGDDITGADDEDGVTLNGIDFNGQTLLFTESYTLDITTMGQGNLSAWIDWNQDGDFLDAGEQIAVDVASGGGALNLPLTIPATAKLGSIYARFRYTTDTGITSVGLASDGEVEDYQFILEGVPLGCDAKLYLSQSSTASVATTLRDIQTSSNPFTYPAVGDNSHGYIYNAITLNPMDGYVYAISGRLNGVGSMGNLLRIHENGVVQDLGPSGLPTVNNFVWAGGTFDNSGNYYVEDGSVPNDRLYVIDVTSQTLTNTLNLTSSGNALSIYVPDMTYSVMDGLLYGVDNIGTKELVSINPSNGEVTVIGNTGVGGVGFGAMYGSSTGAIFGANNSGGFYQFNKETGTGTLISSAPPADRNDGAHCVTQPIQFAADLAVTKDDGTATYVPGTSTTYEIVVTNKGPFGVQNALFEDMLPTGISAAQFSWEVIAISNGSSILESSDNTALSVGSMGTGAVSHLVSLPFDGNADAGGTVTYAVTIDIPLDYTGDLVNTATITPPDDVTDPTPDDNEDTDTDVPLNLDIAKTSGMATFVDDGANGAFDVSYTLTVTNSGEAGVYSLLDTPTPPAGMSVTSVELTAGAGTITMMPSNGTMDASVSNEPIAAGPDEVETWNVLVRFTIDTPADVVTGIDTCDEDNTMMGGFANSVFSLADTDDTNNDACVDVPDPNITVEKDVTAPTGDAVAAGGNVTFAITVENNGMGVANAVTVEDMIPSGLDFVSATPGGGTTFDEGPPSIWTVGTLMPGQSETLELVVTLNPIAGICAPEYVNEVIAETSSDETDDTDNDASATAYLVSIAVAKQHMSSTAVGSGEVGDFRYQVIYELLAVNNGGVALDNVQIIDDLNQIINDPNDNDAIIVPDSASVMSTGGVSLTPNPNYDGINDTNLLIGDDTLAAGSEATVTITFEMLIDVYFGDFTNQATITAMAGDVAVEDLSEDGPAVTNGSRLFSANAVTNDNGCVQDSPTVFRLNIPATPATVNWFKASDLGGIVAFDWTSGAEIANAGFIVEAQDEDGNWNPVSELIPSQGDATVEQHYQHEVVTSATVFRLVDVDISGKRTEHGPYELDTDYGQRSPRKATDWDAIEQDSDAAREAREQRLREQLREKLQQSAPTTYWFRAPQSEPATPVLEENRMQPTNTQPDSWLSRVKTGAVGLLALGLNSLVPSAHALDVAALDIHTSGVYKVRHQDLLNAGIDLSGISKHQIGIRHVEHGSVPVKVTGGNSFGASSTITFAAYDLTTTYVDKNTYVLTVNEGQVEIGTDDGAIPTGPAAYSYLAHKRHAPQNHYSHTSPDRHDAWYAESLKAISSPASTDITLEVDGYAPVVGSTSSTGSAAQSAVARPTLQLDLWGASNPKGDGVANPDHHVTVDLNGERIQDIRFDGLQVKQTEQVLDNLASGTQSITLSLPKSHGYAFDFVRLDEIAISYPRKFWAEQSKHLVFDSEWNKFLVRKLNSETNVEVYRMNAQGDVDQITQTQGKGCTNGQCRVMFKGADEKGQLHRYFVSSAPRTPGIRLVDPDMAPIAGQVDHILIAHSDFINNSQLQAYANQLQANGDTVEIVDVAGIYARYTGHIVDASAIQAYIQEAYELRGTRNISLIGDDNYDYHNNLGTNAQSFIPSLYVRIAQNVNAVPSDPKYADIDDDNIPDLGITRLPVRSNTELNRILAKHSAYQNRSYSNKTLFAADEQENSGYSFKADAEAIKASFNGWQASTAYMDDMTPTQASQTVVNQINQGVSLTHYFGHGNTDRWGRNDALLVGEQVGNLINQGKPTVVLQWACWNNFYVNPQEDALGHRFLTESENGAVTVMGATSLTTADAEQALAQKLYAHLHQGKSIAKAVLDAKRELALDRPHQLDILLGWTTLGPADMVVSP